MTDSTNTKAGQLGRLWSARVMGPPAPAVDLVRHPEPQRARSLTAGELIAMARAARIGRGTA